MTTKNLTKYLFLLISIYLSFFSLEVSGQSAPANFRFTEEKCDRLILSWDDYPPGLNETGYEIYISYGNIGLYSLYTTLNANTLTFAFVTYGLKTSLEPSFKIKAVFGPNKSDFSNSIQSNFICTAPANLQVTSIVCDKIDLSWDGSYDYYKIYRSQSGENGYYEELRNSYPNLYYGNSATISTINNVDGKKYFYKVKGFVYFQDGYNTYQYNSDFTNYAEAIVNCEVPTGLKIVESDCNGIKLSWNKYSSIPNSTNYEIYRSDFGENGPYYPIGSTFNYTDSSYVDIGYKSNYYDHPLIKDKDYYYKIAAVYFGKATPLSLPILAQLQCNIPKIESLVATQDNCGGINISWDDYPPEYSESGFDVFRSTGLYPDSFIKIASIGPNITSYTDRGYSSSTTINNINYNFQNQDHFYKIVGRFTTIASGYSNITAGHIGPCPSAPTGLKITVNACQNIQLAWDDLPANIEETGFGIYLKRGSNGTYNYIGYVNANVLTFTDNGSNGYLTGGETYSYMIKGLFNNTSTDFTEPVTATFICGSPILNSVSQQIDTNGILLNWQYNPNGFTNYGIRIYRSSTGEFGNYKLVFSSNGNSYTANDRFELKDGKEYFYKLTAAYGYIESNFSNSIGIVFQFSTPAPTNFRIVNSNCNAINLAWDNYPQNSNQTGYIIHRRALGAFESANRDIEIKISSRLTNTYVDRYMLEEDVNYEYSIEGIFYNSISTSEGTPVSVKLNCFAPISLSINSSTCGSINLTWTSLPLNAKVKSYVIYRSETGPNGTFEKIGSVANPSLAYSDNPHSYFQTHWYYTFIPILFESDKEYHYKVRGYLNDNYTVFDTYTQFSNTIAGTFHCDGPTNIQKTTISCNSINLSWDASNSQNIPEFKYLVFRSDNGINGNYKLMASPETNAISDQTDLIPGQQYHYKIKTQVGNVLSAFGPVFDTIFECPTMCFSTKTGIWTDPTAWSCGHVPTILNEVIIKTGHIITIEANNIGNAKIVNVQGDLMISNMGKLISIPH